jgi:hypothetical protein
MEMEPKILANKIIKIEGIRNDLKKLPRLMFNYKMLMIKFGKKFSHKSECYAYFIYRLYMKYYWKAAREKAQGLLIKSDLNPI